MLKAHQPTNQLPASPLYLPSDGVDRTGCNFGYGVLFLGPNLHRGEVLSRRDWVL
jgi:hypothetical protein